MSPDPACSRSMPPARVRGDGGDAGALQVEQPARAEGDAGADTPSLSPTRVSVPPPAPPSCSPPVLVQLPVNPPSVSERLVPSRVTALADGVGDEVEGS